MHKSPCRHFKEIGVCCYCTAVKPMKALPDCDFGTESYCINNLYKPQNLYQDISDGHFLFGLDIVGDGYILIAEEV